MYIGHTKCIVHAHIYWPVFISDFWLYITHQISCIWQN